ncbi:diguanylate cyclase (GGDEF)-like protein [Duganella sp. 1224]|uniref:sensor domain-containing diguanylate cyclase n=1 Tax=Duganella sp. 1224 TaxID=2587052 RepID=UPI0015C9E613|nr:diguanylate cyclase [Duganella sp. 1224]NYE61786.1 diguanylate cyclase (GGDEF)-like protein [Duganella sp. 1224]
MIKREKFWRRPGWLFCLLLPLFHFASVKLTFFCAVTPENAVVVWLPNAVLLAALLRFRGRRAPLMAALTFSSDVLANLPVFRWYEAVLFSAVNLLEVAVAYRLMLLSRASPHLHRLQDLIKFILAGPVCGALLAGLAAAVVLQQVGGSATPYLTLARVWWFGDGLGLLIYTPLLLAFTQPQHQRPRLTRWDDAALVLTLLLALAVLSAQGGQIENVSVTPTLLLPAVAVIAFRFGVRLTTLLVALISLGTAMMMTTGLKPFGEVPIHLEVVRAQEFILTLCIIGIGFAVLLNELQTRERELESRVRARTRELERSNARLAAISATDGLTGIPNRRRFDETLAAEWSRARRSGQPLMLALIDVDLFKQYNDYYGHQAGDDALRAVAAALASHARRSGDFVARYGGEEFALIAQCADKEQALQMAAIICRCVAELKIPHMTSPYEVLTISVGVTVLRPCEHDLILSALKTADVALYRAKQLGRNRVEAADVEPVA